MSRDKFKKFESSSYITMCTNLRVLLSEVAEAKVFSATVALLGRIKARPSANVNSSMIKLLTIRGAILSR